jgi:hypothetical protein
MELRKPGLLHFKEVPEERSALISPRIPASQLRFAHICRRGAPRTEG